MPQPPITEISLKNYLSKISFKFPRGQWLNLSSDDKNGFSDQPIVQLCKVPVFLVFSLFWAQVEWWLEHRHGWLVKRQWAGLILGWVSRDEYQVLGSTSIPARCVTLVYREPFSWLTSVGTTRNTVIRLGWSRIGLAVLILHVAGVGLTDRPAVISGRYNKYHSLQLQNYYAHFPPLQHTHIHANTTMRNWSWEWSWVSRHCMLTVAGGILCDRVKRPIDH